MDPRPHYISFLFNNDKKSKTSFHDLNPIPKQEDPISHSEILKKYTNLDCEVESNEKASEDKYMSPDIVQENEIYEIQEINVVKYLDLTRNGKKSKVYHISYFLQNKEYSTKRSYKEFLKLHQELRKIFFNAIFPVFPPKRPNSSNDPTTFEERLKCFNVFLKFLVKKNFITNNVIFFLKSNETLPYYGGYEDASNSDQISFRKKNISNPSPEKSNVFTKSLEDEGKAESSDQSRNINLCVAKNKSLYQNRTECSYGVLIKENENDDNSDKNYEINIINYNTQDIFITIFKKYSEIQKFYKDCFSTYLRKGVSYHKITTKDKSRQERENHMKKQLEEVFENLEAIDKSLVSNFFNYGKF